MKLACLFRAAAMVLFVAILSSSSALSKVILVDDNKVECPSATFTRIQDAVNSASPGDTIHVCKGTYVEQVTIHISLTIAADNGAVLMPSNMQSNTTSLFDAAPLAVALLVLDATDVSIHGLIVDGVNNGISGCSPDLFGIAFQNASGTVRRTTVRNFKLATNLDGCQSGNGIFVESGGGQVSSVTLESNSIHDFQKNGITADEVGTTVLIRANTVTGIGPTTGAAQNGIQLGFGAAGAIRNNTVTNNVWSPCTSAATCTTAVAANILVIQSDGITISGNDVGVSQLGIFVLGNSATVSGNDTSADVVFDGIRLEGSDNTVRANSVVNAAEAGIYLDGNNNVIRNNTITEASVGILKTTTSTGSLIQGNSIFDSINTIQDPPSTSLAKLIKPIR